jgi:hypothetical protein
MLKTIARPAAAKRSQASFAETQFLHDEADADYNGFAPTQIMVLDRRAPSGAARLRCETATPFAPLASDDDFTPASWATARWVEEQEAKALDLARRAQAARATQGALAAAAQSSRHPARRGWLARFEDALERLLPGNLGSLLQLFICVSLSMALISAVLPLVDRI